MAKKKWVQGADIQKGALHAKLGIPEGQKIPLGTLKAAAAKGGKISKQANLAMTFRKMK